MEEIVFLNGNFFPQSRASFPVTTPGILYGWGLFETMRLRKGKIVYFAEHIARIKRGCGSVNINFSFTPSGLRKIIKKLVKANALSDARVRLTVWKEAKNSAVILITAKKYQPFPAAKYKVGFSCTVSPFRQDEDSFLSRLKTTNRILFQLSHLDARKRGFDEAIILNNRGYLTEASRSNLFFVMRGCIFTPALECGCLGGITRKAVFDIARKHGIKIYEGNFTLKDLSAADEVFLTNSMMGIMPLRSVDGCPVGNRSREPKYIRLFGEEYGILLENES